MTPALLSNLRSWVELHQYDAVAGRGIDFDDEADAGRVVLVILTGGTRTYRRNVVIQGRPTEDSRHET